MKKFLITAFILCSANSLYSSVPEQSNEGSQDGLATACSGGGAVVCAAGTKSPGSDGYAAAVLAEDAVLSDDDSRGVSQSVSNSVTPRAVGQSPALSSARSPSIVSSDDDELLESRLREAAAQLQARRRDLGLDPGGPITLEELRVLRIQRGNDVYNEALCEAWKNLVATDDIGFHNLPEEIAYLILRHY